MKSIALAVGMLMVYPAWSHAPEKSRTITWDGGGSVESYIGWRNLLEKEHTKLRIMGPCYSACTLYVGLPKHQLCVGPEARLLVHAPRKRSDGSTDPKRTAHFQSYYPLWLNQYIALRGGLTKDWIEIPPVLFRLHIKPCTY